MMQVEASIVEIGVIGDILLDEDYAASCDLISIT